jgi:D-glycero-alpha-D-manno-heptose-7-phosphate kinase
MSDNFKEYLQTGKIEISVPCRIDMGGTLDISTFYYPMMHLNPCTFNIAIDLRTKVSLLPFEKGKIKVSSRGFRSAVFNAHKAPFNHPLGLMFAIPAFFNADGIHIVINSSSPPKSALGGSSAAAVALVAGFLKLSEKSGGKPFSRRKAVLIAHAIEQSVAGVPCGMQDQLAAAFGGVNAWFWRDRTKGPEFIKKSIFKKDFLNDFGKNIIIAYCGIPHESKNINSRWVNQFISGKYRRLWDEIVICTERFVDAVSKRNFQDAAIFMSRETEIRKRMTPDVVDEIGRRLIKSAPKNGCGARFTGAGGGGCIWAIGEASGIERLKEKWEAILSMRKGAGLLQFGIDYEGLLIEL